MAIKYRNYAEFEREYIRPGMRVGATFEDMIRDRRLTSEGSPHQMFDSYDDEEEEEER